MTTIKGDFGGPGGQPPTLDSIDLTHGKYPSGKSIDYLEFSDSTRGKTTINFVDDDETNGVGGYRWLNGVGIVDGCPDADCKNLYTEDPINEDVWLFNGFEKGAIELTCQKDSQDIQQSNIGFYLILVLLG